MERATSEFESETEDKIRLPRPVPGGNEAIESLGRFIDNLMGDARMHRAAKRELEPLLLKEEEMEPDPEPLDLPEPVPGGTEETTRGGRPGEQRA